MDKTFFEFSAEETRNNNAAPRRATVAKATVHYSEVDEFFSATPFLHTSIKTAIAAKYLAGLAVSAENGPVHE